MCSWYLRSPGICWLSSFDVLQSNNQLRVSRSWLLVIYRWLLNYSASIGTWSVCAWRTLRENCTKEERGQRQCNLIHVSFKSITRRREGVNVKVALYWQWSVIWKPPIYKSVNGSHMLLHHDVNIRRHCLLEHLRQRNLHFSAVLIM